MSLIINVLKELEDRERELEITPYLAIKSKKLTATFLYPYLIIGIMIISLLAFTMIRLITHRHATAVIPKMQQQSITPINTITPDAKWLQPVSINGITIQVKGNITEVTFLLNHASLYRLTSNDILNQLAIQLDNADLQAEIPILHYLNTAVQGINVERSQRNIKFILSLAPGTNVKYINLNEEGKNAELVVAVEFPTIPFKTTTAATTTTPTIKTTAMTSLLEQQYQTAIAAAGRGDNTNAINSLMALLKSIPDHYDARVSLVALLMGQGNIRDAKEILEQGLSQHPDYSPFIELKARLLSSEGKINEALNLLLNAQPAIEENPDYYALTAALHEQNNHPQLAVTIYNQLLHIDPHKSSWWFGLAVSSDKLGRQKVAITAYNKAITEGQLSAESLAYAQTRLHELGGDVHDQTE